MYIITDPHESPMIHFFSGEKRTRMVFHWPSWQQLEQLSPAFWARLVPHVVLGEKGQPPGNLEMLPSGKLT